MKAAVTGAQRAQLSDCAGLGALHRVNASLVPLFVHGTLDEVCGRTHDFAPYQRALGCDAKDVTRLRVAWKLFVRLAVGRGLSTDDMVADLKAAGVADDALAAGVVALITSREVELRASLAATPSCTPALRDFDWKVNLTLASDKAASLNMPVMLLALDIAQPLSDVELAEGASATQRHVLELTQPDLAKLVAQLEAMNAAMAEL